MTKVLKYCSFVVVLYLAYFLSHFDSLLDLFSWIMSYVPVHWVPNYLGNGFYWIMHKYVFPFLDFPECFEKQENSSKVLRTIVTSLKGGSVLSCRISWDIAYFCGLSMTLGRIPHDQWPFPEEIVEIPNFEVDLYMGLVNGGNWEKYSKLDINKEKVLQCVVFTRNPWDQLASIYAYTKDGRESGLRKLSRDMHSLTTVQDRVNLLWKSIGKETMQISEKVLSHAINRNCLQIQMEEFKTDFDAAVSKLLLYFNIKKTILPQLIQAVKGNDISSLSQDKRDSNPHLSGKTLEPGEKEELMRVLKNHSEIKDLLANSCKKLNYLC